MPEPRLRTVNRAVPPYPINKFPHNFLLRLSADIVYAYATKQVMSIEGEDWEQIFAHCINAEWKPSNVGLDDVQLGNCCWSAKTVFGNSNLANQSTVRLISGRNSVAYSFGVDRILEANPNDIGRMVLEIWNERVSGIRQYFKFARTIVLVKSKDFNDFLLFETDTIRYEPDLFYFKWNKRGNLEGYTKSNDTHKFTWQPHGSQFTIIEDIPVERLHFKVRKPERLDQDKVLESVGFNSGWLINITNELDSTESIDATVCIH